MKIPVQVSFLSLCTILLIATIATADTLYLKNGMYIVVTRATEKNGQIEYWVGSTKYTISKDLVAKIEPGNGPSARIHSAAPVHGAAPGVQDLQPAGSPNRYRNRKPRQVAVAFPWRTEGARTLLGRPADPHYARGSRQRDEVG